MSKQYMRLANKKDLTVDDTGRLLIEDLVQAYNTGKFILTRQERAELMRHTSINWQALYSAMTTARDRYTKAFYVILLDLKEFELNETTIIYEEELRGRKNTENILVVVAPDYAERIQWRYRQMIGLEVCAKYMSKISKVKGIAEAITGINKAEADDDGITADAIKFGLLEGEIIPNFNTLLSDYRKKVKSEQPLKFLNQAQPIFFYSDKVKLQTYRALSKYDKFNFDNLLLELDYNAMQEETEQLLDKYYKQEHGNSDFYDSVVASFGK